MPAGQSVPCGRQHGGGAAIHRIGDEVAAVAAAAGKGCEQEAGRHLAAVGGDAAQVECRGMAPGGGRVGASARMRSASSNGRGRRRGGDQARLVPDVARRRQAGGVMAGTGGRRIGAARRRSGGPPAGLAPAGRPGCSGMNSSAWIAAALSRSGSSPSIGADARDDPPDRRRDHPAGGGIAVRAGIRLRLVEHHVDGVARRVHREGAHEGGDVGVLGVPPCG